MGLLWWPKNTASSSAATTKRQGEAATDATTVASAASSCNSFSTSSHCPACLTKLVRKLKKQARIISLVPSRQASFECRYDPLSYSLNFDDTSTGCRNNLLDEDNYYKFCAFSSRFVANPRTSPRIVTASAH